MGSHLGSHIQSESPTKEGWDWRDAEGLEGSGRLVAEKCWTGLDTGETDRQYYIHVLKMHRKRGYWGQKNKQLCFN